MVDVQTEPKTILVQCLHILTQIFIYKIIINYNVPDKLSCALYYRCLNVYMVSYVHVPRHIPHPIKGFTV